MTVSALEQTTFIRALLAGGLIGAISCGVLAEQPGGAVTLEGGNARVVFVGDSITGLARNRADGFAHLMEAALKAVHPDAKPDLVALGGSGQGVFSWASVEKRSRENEVFLDVRGIDVRTHLDQPADVLVVMLGMNDVLAPYIGEDKAALDRWEGSYLRLVEALRKRVKPGAIAFGTISLCTEAPDSPKNRLIARVNLRATALAKELGAIVIPANEALWEVLKRGRTLKPDFHVTYDFVHPNAAGQIAIARAMLRAMGEPRAAKWLGKTRLAPLLASAAGAEPSFSYQVKPLATPLAESRHSFTIRYWLTAQAANEPAPRVALRAPDGWRVEPEFAEGHEGVFCASGNPNRKCNILTLTTNLAGKPCLKEAGIPALWLVAAEFVQGWNGNAFLADRARTPIDEAIENGGRFAGPIDLGEGRSLTWQRHFPSVNYTGLDAAGSVDFAAVTHAVNFEGGYGTRRIHSEHDRPIKLQLGTGVFAGNIHLTVWLNSQEQYRGHITGEPKKRKTVGARLLEGWNTLVFKANHRTWQCQVSVAVEPVGDDTLDDLRYSTGLSQNGLRPQPNAVFR